MCETLLLPLHPCKKVKSSLLRISESTLPSSGFRTSGTSPQPLNRLRPCEAGVGYIGTSSAVNLPPLVNLTAQTGIVVSVMVIFITVTESASLLGVPGAIDSPKHAAFPAVG